MKLTGKIEAVTSVSQGVSQMGNPWKSCSIVLVCTETVEGREVKNRFLIHCLNDACDDALEQLENFSDDSGEIAGTWCVTCYSAVRKWMSKAGREIVNQEINLVKLERVGQ